MLTLIVGGDRHWRDYDVAYEALSMFPKDTRLRHGGCRGADLVCADIADELGFHVEPPFLPKWQEQGPNAGPIRNGHMVTARPRADLVLAFHVDIGRSKGTRDLLRQAREAKIPTCLVTGGRSLSGLATLVSTLASGRTLPVLD